LYGSEYVTPLPVLAVLMLCGLYIPFLWAGPLLRVSGHIKTAVQTECGATLTGIALMLLLVHQLGALGVAIGFVSRPILYSVIVGLYFYRQRREYFT